LFFQDPDDWNKRAFAAFFSMLQAACEGRRRRRRRRRPQGCANASWFSKESKPNENLRPTETFFHCLLRFLEGFISNSRFNFNNRFLPTSWDKRFFQSVTFYFLLIQISI
jgi:hypothetical protein